MHKVYSITDPREPEKGPNFTTNLIDATVAQLRGKKVYVMNGEWKEIKLTITAKEL